MCGFVSESILVEALKSVALMQHLAVDDAFAKMHGEETASEFFKLIMGVGKHRSGV